MTPPVSRHHVPWIPAARNSSLSVIGGLALLLGTVLPAASGPNSGGTLILAYDTSGDLTDSVPVDCWLTTPELPGSCDEVQSSTGVLNSKTRIHVLAAFSPGSLPRLAGLTFGITYGTGLVIDGYATCGDFEIAEASWPASNSGTAVTFATEYPTSPSGDPWLVEIYSFVVANYGTVETFALGPHPVQGGWFADGDGTLDAIADFGVFGFGTAGHLPCPEEVIPAACCIGTSCEVLAPNDCDFEGGEYQGAGSVCTPNPCVDPAETGACCDLSTGVCTTQVQSVCASLGGQFLGEGTVCNPNPCPQPHWGCCFPDGTCTIETPEDCAAAGGETVFGQGCDPNLCPQPLGACCFSNGDCFNLIEDLCLPSGGAWQGPFTTCDSDPCPPVPTGACCLVTGCVIEDPVDCGLQGGDYVGDDTACTPNPCPDIFVCCFEDGSCQVVVSDFCLSLGGVPGVEDVCDPNPCPQPIVACCFDPEICELQELPDCLAAGGVPTGETCDPNPCLLPQGACCMLTGACSITDPIECEEVLNGTWLGTGIPCNPNPCPISIGACCIELECALLDSGDCALSGGVYLGGGVLCDPNPCDSPEGACCLADGFCIVIDSFNCEASGGYWLGFGTTCDPNPCSSPAGACCFESTCTVQSEFGCDAAEGIYLGDNTTCDPNPCVPVPSHETTWGRIKHEGRQPAP